MVASEIEKPDLRIFVLIDVGVRSLIVGYMVERHTWSLLPESIPDERKACAVDLGPHFLDVVMIHQVRLAHGERIERNGQNSLQRAQAVRSHE